jgi:phosphoribosylcarboxyaminoimidazole (NCAIR) mutase
MAVALVLEGQVVASKTPANVVGVPVVSVRQNTP